MQIEKEKNQGNVNIFPHQSVMPQINKLLTFCMRRKQMKCSLLDQDFLSIELIVRRLLGVPPPTNLPCRRPIIISKILIFVNSTLL